MANAGKLTYRTRINPETDRHYDVNDRGRVFISYKKSDNRLSGVRDIVADRILEMVDCAVWYDENLTPGVDYNDEIQQAISESYAVILLLTRDILESDYVWKEEIPAAIRQQKGIIPIAFDFPKELYGEVERRAGCPMQIIRWPTGAEADTPEELEAFNDAFLRALDRFVISTDRSQKIRAVFQSDRELPSFAHITPYDRFLIGCAYLDGICTEKDEGSGEVLLNSVANFFAGDEESISLKSEAANVLFRYYYEQGDMKNARENARLGAAINDPELTFRLGMMYRTGKGTGRDLDKAAELFAAAAARRHPKAMCALGKMYMKGDCLDQNKPKAFSLFSEAAGMGDGEAMQQLADIYYKGDGVPVDCASAEYWYNKAAEGNGCLAMRQLGKKYEDGEGVEKNLAKAFHWYDGSAHKGDAISMRNLGDMYRKGIYVQENKDKAFFWYFNSAAMGNAVAMRNLGDMYSTGEGGELSIAKACEWYAKAAEHGNEKAAEQLRKLESELPATAVQEAAPAAPAAVPEAAPVTRAAQPAPAPAPVAAPAAVPAKAAPAQLAAPLYRKEIKAAQKAEKAAQKEAAKAEKAAAKAAKKAARR